MVLSMHTHKMFPSCGCSSSVERQLPKLDRRVRLPSSAPEDQRTVKKGLSFLHSLFLCSKGCHPDRGRRVCRKDYYPIYNNYLK